MDRALILYEVGGGGVKTKQEIDVLFQKENRQLAQKKSKSGRSDKLGKSKESTGGHGGMNCRAIP